MSKCVSKSSVYFATVSLYLGNRTFTSVMKDHFQHLVLFVNFITALLQVIYSNLNLKHIFLY